MLYRAHLLFTTFLETVLERWFLLLFQMKKLSLREAQVTQLVKAYIFLTPLCFSLCQRPLWYTHSRNMHAYFCINTQTNRFKDWAREKKIQRIIWRSKKFGFSLTPKHEAFAEEILCEWNKIFQVMALLLSHCAFNTVLRFWLIVCWN